MIQSLPRFHHRPGPPLEADLAAWAEERPAALILPCHVRDAETAAFQHILRTLRHAVWLRAVVIGLDGEDPRGMARAGILRELPAAVVLPGREPAGKGGNIQRCLRHIADELPCYAAAVHDCDILSYEAEFPARLCWPVLCPEASWTFCKGAYHRVSDRLHGRLTRLMFRPLVAALRGTAAGPADSSWLDSLQTWHYPLAGECCATMAFWETCGLSSGWGVEVDVLRRASELPPTACGQVELCAAYDHRHHELSAADPSQGLHRSAREVATALLQTMTAIPAGLTDRFSMAAAEALHVSRLTARLNGLMWDEVEESLAVETFTSVIRGLV